MPGVLIDLWVADLSTPGWRGFAGPSPDEPEPMSAAGRLMRAAFMTAQPHRINNLSHAAGLVVLAAGDRRSIDRLGVDVEAKRSLPRPQVLRRRISAVGERPDGDVVRAWTLKEAVLKATGEGLAGDPRAWRFESADTFGPGLASLPADAGPAHLWAFCVLDLRRQMAWLSVAARLTTPGRLTLRRHVVRTPPSR